MFDIFIIFKGKYVRCLLVIVYEKRVNTNSDIRFDLLIKFHGNWTVVQLNFHLIRARLGKSHIKSKVYLRDCPILSFSL